MNIIQTISLVGTCLLAYLILQEFNKTYAKAFVYVLLTYFFILTLEILANIIAQISTVFIQFEIGETYLTTIVKLIGVIYYAEFIGIILKEAKLDNLIKVVEYLVKLNLIAYSLPLIITLLELILSVF